MRKRSRVEDHVLIVHRPAPPGNARPVPLPHPCSTNQDDLNPAQALRLLRLPSPTEGVPSPHPFPPTPSAGHADGAQADAQADAKLDTSMLWLVYARFIAELAVCAVHPLQGALLDFLNLFP